MMRNSYLQALSLCAFPACVFTVFGQNQTVINEIHYDPDIKTDRVEFIELYNRGTSAVNLAGWYFTEGIDYTFPAGTTLAPGGYIVVAEKPTALQTKFGFAGALGPWTGNLAAEGEQITLLNAAGETEDSVDYQLGFPWPTVGDPITEATPGSGSSIELISPFLDNDLGGHWRASLNTPAVATNTTLLPERASWKYLKGTAEASFPTTEWRQTNFDDSSWTSGGLPIGYGETFLVTPLADMNTNYTSVFLRKTFVVANPAQFTRLVLQAQYDDGFKVWINGVNVIDGQANMPAGEVPYSGSAVTAVESTNFLSFNLTAAPATLLVPGTNIIAVQAHNSSLSSSTDFFFDARLLGQTGGSGTLGPSPGRINSVFASNPPPATRQVTHSPEQPVAGEVVKITAKITDADSVTNVVLEYQLVNPGSYIERTDAAYATNWTAVSMRDDGTAGDETAGDDTFSVDLPSSLQTHRRLVRYRIVVTDGGGRSVRVPYADDPQPNFAYFCYNGTPEWRGAARPGVTAVQTFSSNEMSRLPAIHLIGRSNVIATATWFSRYGGDAYQWNGALVYDGKVYDHIHYRARGGVWRYSMVKNMWKFDMNRGHDFEARDNWGKRFKTSWTKVNLGASIQQADSQHRGEQGMFESVGFRMFQLAGVASPNSAFVTFRVIDEAQEASPTTQFEGDFWGVYLLIEQENGRFLDENDLPDSNLYKMEGGTGELNNLGPNGPVNKSDLTAILPQNNAGKPESWWRTNWNMPKYFSYQAIAQAVHHYDICYDKNFFYYYNSDTRLWEITSWDLDLIWANNMYDSGCGGKDRVYQRVFDETNPAKPNFRIEWNNRMREIRDLLFNADQGGKLIDEYARLLRGTNSGPTILDADRAQWDYNPKMVSSTYTPNLNKATQGIYYQFPLEFATNSSLRGSFNALVQIMKNYVGIRGTFLDTLSADANRPARPVITSTAPPNYPINRLSFRSSSYSGAGAFASMKWRIGEVTDTNSPNYNPGEPWEYEIEPVWDSGPLPTFNSDITINPTGLKVGHRYRARVQMKDVTGRASNWSLPVEFVIGEPDNLAALLGSLRISEVMFNPPEGSTYEYIELHNTSAQFPLDLSAVKFTQGIDYTFQPGTIIPPNSYLILARTNDLESFRSHYAVPTNVVVVGPYSGSLDNSGEQIVLRTSAGGTDILSFGYRDTRGWPGTADGAGHSMVPIDSAEAGQITGSLSQGGNWRASAFIRGSPGRADVLPASTVVLNEVVAHTDFVAEFDSNDWIELFNTTPSPITFGPYWFLSDDDTDLKKWAIPAASVIPAGGWLTFDEVTGFHNPTNIGFGLSKAGEQVYLSYLPGIEGDRVVDSISFKGQENDWSVGRYPDGSNVWYALNPRTRSSANSAPPPHVLITEIMYHPPDIGGLDNSADEFVELYNPLPTAVSLQNTNGTWRIDGGISFSLPTNTVLPVGGYLLVVNFNPADAAKLAAFRTLYGITNAALPIVGPFSGQLGNGSERVALERPLAPDLPGDSVAWVIVDEVLYADHAPWPYGTDGNGASLQRRSLTGYSSDPALWAGTLASAGRPYGGGILPSVTAQPTNQTVLEGNAATFSVAAVGTEPLSYQWHFNGAAISGATASTLTISNAQADDAGPYYALVLNPAGSAASGNATLTVNLYPRITAHPESQALRPGSNVTFSVVALGTAPLRYQWNFNGVDLTNATNSSLTVTNIQLPNAGLYAVTIDDRIGSITSAPATLTVLAPPVINSPPVNQSVVVGGTAVFSVSAVGMTPLTYRWRSGPNFLPGQTNASLVLTNVQPTNAGSYSVVITNFAGTRLSSSVTLTVLEDNDHDGMADAWETLVGLNPESAADGATDADGDTMSNRDEYVAGTDPFDRLSYLKVEALPGNPARATFLLRFAAVSNLSYSLQNRDGLAGAWAKLFDVDASASNRVVELTNPIPNNFGQRLYRLVTPRLL